MSPRPATVVRVLGLALAAVACKSEEPIHGNPPPPERVEPPTNPPVPEPEPIAINPPQPLPTWESVKSTHPAGATNPPSPALFVTADAHDCFKVWVGGMRGPERDILEAGGRVVANSAAVPNGTQVQCPPGQPDALLTAYAKLDPALLPTAR